jgi:hypothetical protein
MKQSQFYYLLRRGLFSAGSAIIKNGLVMFNKFTTAGLNFPAQGSAEFDGASYIQLDTPFSYTNHTIAAWCYTQDLGAVGIILDSRDSTSDGHSLFFGSDETINYRILGNVISTTESYINEWVYVVGVYDGSTQKIYANGNLAVSTSFSATIDVSTNSTIGARNFISPAAYFKGNLANVAIWNRALSSDEINSVMWKSYEALSGAESNGLQAWYSLDDISGSSVPDSSGNGNNGTAY